MVLYPNKLPESERVCSGICKRRKNIRIIVKMLNAMNIGYVYAYQLKKIEI